MRIKYKHTIASQVLDGQIRSLRRHRIIPPPATVGGLPYRGFMHIIDLVALKEDRDVVVVTDAIDETLNSICVCSEEVEAVEEPND